MPNFKTNFSDCYSNSFSSQSNKYLWKLAVATDFSQLIKCLQNLQKSIKQKDVMSFLVPVQWNENYRFFSSNE